MTRCRAAPGVTPGLAAGFSRNDNAEIICLGRGGKPPALPRWPIRLPCDTTELAHMLIAAGAAVLPDQRDLVELAARGAVLDGFQKIRLGRGRPPRPGRGR